MKYRTHKCSNIYYIEDVKQIRLFVFNVSSSRLKKALLSLLNSFYLLLSLMVWFDYFSAMKDLFVHGICHVL